MKIENITEMTAGATGSGSVASVAQPVGKMQKRAGSLFKGKTTKKPFYEQEATSSIAQGVSEATLSEEDFILMPGQGRKLKPGLISKRPDHEVEMARGDLYQSAKNAKQICDMLSNVSEMQGLDGWVQAKITKASDYLNSVRQYLEGRQQAVTEGADDICPQCGMKGCKCAPGKCKCKPKPGYPKSEDISESVAIANKLINEGALSDFTPPFKVRDQWVIDRRGYGVLEVSDRGSLASDIAQLLNRHQPRRKSDTVSETEKPSAREKFNKGLKKAGYDPEKGADRLFSLLKKQAEEREKFEKAMPAVYGDKEGVAEGISDRPDAHISLLFYKKVNDVEYRLTKQGDDYKVFVGRKRQKYPDFESARAGLYQHLLNAQGVAESALDEACWKGYHKEGNKKMFGKTYPNCVKNEGQALDEAREQCPECGGAMYSSELINEKKDACYYKVKSRYKVWPSAYASGALVKCRNKGASNWGNKSESVEEDASELSENLNQWFKEKWVRFGPDGKIRGDCARGDDSEGKPKCLPQKKAQALGKKGRASSAAKKRREDPNPERRGAAKNVATKVKEGTEQKKLVNDYDQWRDQVSALGGEIHPQQNKNHMVAQSWSGDTIGEFHMGREQGYIVQGQQDMTEGED